MRRAKQPSKQLNSEAIRGAALCYMSPVVAGQCSIISVKCVLNVKEKDLSKSWSSICKKRDVCDKAMSGIQNAAFFFSAIATQEKKKGSINVESDDSEEEQTQSPIPSTQSEQLVDGNPTLVNKSLWPAITYWLALTTPNGAPANPLVVHRALLKCGVAVTANQVQFQDGKECVAIKEIYKLLKDHKNPYMQELVTASFQHNYREEYRNRISMSPLSSQELEDCGKENVVRVTLINPSFQQSLTSALGKMIEAKLQIEKFGFDAPNPMTLAGEKRLSDKLTILVNDVTIAMQQLQYASYRGKIYKRNPKASYTYSFKCEARPFINTLATNEQFKSRLIREMKKVIELLSDPHCELFQPLKIDYDLIEVNSGVCWSTKKRSFVQGPIQAHQIGKISPRAFCTYDSTTEPEPKYFQQILENSLSPQEVANFCEDFIKLLNYNKKQHKDKVPCLVGESNSGKTSLFFPIQGLVHHGNIATVTKQRAFNKAMITPFTEIIFIDEATENTLDIADWKILTQGGYSAHDVKYQTAKAFINKCPMLITAQAPLQFGPTHQSAMEKRLRTYQFKSLENPKKGAAAWLKRHAMDCVVWATQKATACQRDSESEEDEDDAASDGDEGILKETEKEELRCLTLGNPLAEEPTASSVDFPVDPDTDPVSPSTSNDVLDSLRDSLCQSRPDSLQHRQVEHMLREEQRKRNVQENLTRKLHEMRKDALKEKGVSTQTAELLPSDPNQVMPTPIEKELDKYWEERRLREEQQRREKALQAYQGSWLLNTERELYDCVKLFHSSPDEYTRASMDALREVLVDKLRNHHTNLGTLRCKDALRERKRVCRTMGLLRKEDENLVKSVTEPLPLALVELASGDEEDEDIFTIPKTPSYVPQHDSAEYSPSSPPMISSPGDEISGEHSASDHDPPSRASGTTTEVLQRMNSTKKRRRQPAHSQDGNKRPRQTLLNYFSQSQKK